jgi:hypothetical protein
MKHATSRELYAYWDRIRGAEAAPRRGDIEPGDIRRILADTFILEVVSRDAYIVRLAGTRMCALYGREIKGSGFLDLWTGADREVIATLATAVSEDAAGAVVTVDLRSPRGQPVSCEFLMLPLRHGGWSYDRILGSCAVHVRPYWFGSEPIVRQQITNLRLVWPDEHPRFMRDAPRPIPQSPLPFAGDGALRRHGHLFVLDGGKL